MRFAVMLAGSLLLLSGCSETDENAALLTLQSSTLEHRIQAEGELFAVNAISINAPQSTRGPRFIAEITPEYSSVSPGDLVIRFDATQLERSRRDASNALSGVLADQDFKGTQQQAELSTIGLDQRLVQQEFAFADRFSIDDIQIRSRLEILDSMQNKEFLGEKQSYLDWQQQSFANRSQGELDLLQLQKGQQQSLLTQAETGLAALEIRAQHKGILLYDSNWRGEKPEVGRMVFPGEKLGSIPDLSLQHVKLLIIEQESVGLAVDQPVFFRLTARPEQVLEGRIQSVGQVAQSRERRDPRRYIEVIVAPSAQQDFFLPGAKVRAEIFANTLPEVLALPLQAIFSDEKGQYVWQQRGGSLQRQAVSLGAKSLTHAEIIEGLSAGDRISLLPPEN
ncbi:efflux RND transporter periplasmic adaptor subunit [Alishewanella sp. HL-SH05]|uniref:efflux RND transporter periplasmic adaptor subunit n=1 Tax=Alishewanella sp. HL-SH05 TaxID=3461145 RepID=UPI0040411756